MLGNSTVPAIYLALLHIGFSCYSTTETTVGVLAFSPPVPIRRKSKTTYLLSMPVLDEWRLLPNNRIEGKVSQHPEIENGSVISTSPIDDPNNILGKKAIIIETKTGSQYLLLNPIESESHEYESYLPMPAMSNNDDHQMTTTTTTTGMTGTDIWSPSLDQQKISAKIDEKEFEPPETKKLMQQVKDAGVAGAISYALWEFGFWTISVPVCVFAYRQVTGHWPDVFNNPEDQKQLAAEAFAFVNVARFAVPLRIGLALSTTPWIQKNIVDRFASGKSD